MLTAILAIQNDDNRKKVENIYEFYRGTMIYVAKNILYDEHQAEDAVVESIIKIIKHIDKINEIDCPQTRAFVVIIVRNTALDMLRSINRNDVVSLDDIADLPDNKAAVLDEIVVKEAYQNIANRIAKMNPAYADVLLLYAEMDCSYDEIAVLMGINLENVKKRLSRARKMLREGLGEEESVG